MHSSGRIVSGIIGTALVAASLPAQLPCPPFPKMGLQPLAWGPGKSITVGNTGTPAGSIALTFDHDAGEGVVLSRIGHVGRHLDGTVTRFDYTTVPPPAESRRLWAAVLRPLGANTPSTLAPTDAQGVSVWFDTVNGSRAVFRWDGCGVPNANARSTFWVEIEVQVSPLTPNRAAWATRVARFENARGTEPFTIDEVHSPIVYVLQPGSSQLARILVPAAQRVPLPATNLSMRSWQVFIPRDAATLEHPAREQQMQFSALYAGDPIALPIGNELISPFRKILYMSTEDTEGHFKNFKHDVVTGPGGLAYYRWSPVHFPAYGPSPQLNCSASPYPAVICALQARNDAYWYDVCAHYREFVRSDMGLTPIRSPQYPLNPDVVRGSVVVATSTLGGFVPNSDEVFETFVDMGRHHQAVFLQPGANAASPLFMEWQKWLKGGPGDPEDPMGPGFNPAPFANVDGTPHNPAAAARREIARAYGLGMNVSVYSLPLVLATSEWPSFDPDWLLRDRLGNTISDVTPGQFLVDLGNKSVPLWLTNVLFDDVMNSTPEMGGFLLDTLGGTGSFLRYPKPGTPFFNFKYHGGTEYVKGGQRLFDALRQRVGRAKTTHSHPDIPFVVTEAVQEFYAGKYDAAQHGLKPLPGHDDLSTFIDQLTAPGATPPPVETQTGSPPLWNIVYHEYSRAEALGMMLSTRGVSALLGGGQPADFGTGVIGLTHQEWGNYNRMVHALMFVQGMKPMLFSYFHNFKDLSLLVEDSGVVGVRNPAVPQQGQLLEFMQRMHGAVSRELEAGQFLNYGVMERPLAMPPLALGVVGFDPALVSTTVNPSIPTLLRNDQILGVTKHFYEDGFTQGLPYPVANIQHSVWRATPTSTRLGLVFVNWTDQQSAWRGTFDPRLYAGFLSGFKVTGVRPNGASIETYPVGTGNGPTVLSWNIAGGGLLLQHHAHPAPLGMPPRSVQVFWIDPL